MAKVLTEVNQFFEKDVADFRKKVDESGLRLLPPFEPIPVKSGELAGLQIIHAVNDNHSRRE